MAPFAIHPSSPLSLRLEAGAPGVPSTGALPSRPIQSSGLPVSRRLPPDPMCASSGRTAGMSGQSLGKVHQRDFGRLAGSVARIAAYLRRAHPVKTADCVADRAGVPAETVRKWLAPNAGAAPSWGAAARLIAAYGPEFLAEAMGLNLDWLSAAAQAERLAAAEQQARAALAEIERLKAGRR